MELTAFAERVLMGTTMEDKFFVPAGGLRALADKNRPAARAWREPGRPATLVIGDKRTRKRLPAPEALHDPQMRVRCLHTFANHELMALELMAWALLAFPEAPKAYRIGLAHIILDEQKHLRLYMDRIAALGGTFGDLPLNDHFWRVAPSLTDPLKFASAVNLTFEQANLDHAPMFARYFDNVEDHDSAALMRHIAQDEIAHVGFGARVLRDHARGRDTFEVWSENLTFHNEPKRARGTEFNEELRREAGLDEAFIRRMRQLSQDT